MLKIWHYAKGHSKFFLFQLLNAVPGRKYVVIKIEYLIDIVSPGSS